MDLPVESARTIGSWSFSRLVEVYEHCPQRAFLEYVEKRPKPEPAPDSKGAAARNRGTAIHTCAEKYIMGESVELIPELLKTEVKPRIEYAKQCYVNGTAKVEEDWGFTRDWTPTGYFEKDTWLRVKHDFTNYIPETTTLEVEDWKSGKRYGNEVKHAQQGILYAITGLIKYPDATRVRTRFTYVDENKSAPKEYDRATIMRLMPSWDVRAKAMTSDTTFKPKPNKINCRFCPYSPNKDGDGSCPFGVEV